MFRGATLFNADISQWDVSSVELMERMFRDATSFNADISKWDVSSVTLMNSMFESATSFNADISKWNVSSVTLMNSMFEGATSFNRTLCGSAWIHSKALKKTGVEKNMFKDSSGKICTCMWWVPNGEHSHG